jgi:class 3 adenylate cyclase
MLRGYARSEAALADVSLGADGLLLERRRPIGCQGLLGVKCPARAATCNSGRLFADLSGFTTLAERLDPEEIRALQGELFEEMASVIKRYDGFVEKFVGDAVMAVFTSHGRWGRTSSTSRQISLPEIIRNPQARASEWILDETVWAVHEIATGLVRNDARYAAYRPLLDDEARMQAHVAYRDRVFLPVRPLDYYLQCLEGAGFVLEEVTARTIETRVDDWFEFPSAYHEATNEALTLGRQARLIAETVGDLALTVAELSPWRSWPRDVRRA